MTSRQTFIFNHFKTLLYSYKGDLPFHHFLKKYCKLHSALGSKDRRILREIMYSVFRLGPLWKTYTAEDLFLAAHTDSADDLLLGFYQNLEKLKLNHTVNYPFSDALSEPLNNPEYFKSLTKQPLVWVRLNSLNLSKFKSKYSSEIIAEEKINEVFTAIGLKNNTGLDSEPMNVEVQDLASQKVCGILQNMEGLNVWDCCSGAGGKSLFMTENFKKIKLYASDIRPTILDNLKLRFKKNRFTLPKLAIADLNKKPEKISFGGESISRGFFDAIVADVPCSGSGTWAREPENLTFFNPNRIDELAMRQLNIVKGALRFLKHGGILYYITCSVFEKENMGVVRELVALNLVKVISTKMVCGYTNKADNLFIAVLVAV